MVEPRMRRTDLPPHRVRVVVAHDPSDLPGRLAGALIQHDGGFSLVPVPIEGVERPHDVQRAVLDRLADAALRMFPSWYGLTGWQALTELNWEGLVGRRHAAQRIVRSRAGIVPDWLRQALDCAADGVAPRVPSLSMDVELAQLCRLVDPDDLVLVTVMNGERPSEVELQAIRDGAEHVATVCDARIVLGIPESWPRAIFRRLGPSLEAPEGRPVHVPPVGGVFGKPHPNSPGEQLLYQKLATDEELKGLFHFGQVVDTEFAGYRPRVDLIWGDGRLIVEVDGWGHALVDQYREDRRRDFALQASGYQVLRLVHGDVVADPGRELEKIRRMVMVQRKFMR